MHAYNARTQKSGEFQVSLATQPNPISIKQQTPKERIHWLRIETLLFASAVGSLERTTVYVSLAGLKSEGKVQKST